MNKNEILKMLSILQISYPNFYKGFDKEQLEQAIILYEEMFKEDDSKLVFRALKEVINTSEYPPTIATIKNKIYEISHHKEPNNSELWDCLLKAIGNSSYHSEEEYEKLPQLVKEYVRNPRQLQEMAVMDSDVIHSVVKGQFMKQIEYIKQNYKEEEITGRKLIQEKKIFQLENMED